MPISRRNFLKLSALSATALLLPSCSPQRDPRPNIILAMSDDQGWGDTGYNGHPVLRTPALDAMAAEGIRLDRFYSGGPVCSPTRGSVMTGRHPNRYGVFSANVGYLPPQEITIAELLKAQGYRTGHFGKWHLGTLSHVLNDGNRGGEDDEGVGAYSPPWIHGFDTCFSTESRVPTWNPMFNPGTEQAFGTHYWTGEGQMVTDNLDGDDSRVIMDRVIPFMESSLAENRPFLAVIWFHTPHVPVIAGPDYSAMYEGEPGAQYYGVLTALDEQMGRLRSELARLSLADNTLLWFCSDNGPELTVGHQNYGSAGVFRAGKRSLYEGGIRVPSVLVWPAKIKAPFSLSMPIVTTDYLPTIADILDLSLPERPYDGISVLAALEGSMTERPKPIPFSYQGQIALSDNRYKMYYAQNLANYELYDLLADPAESTDISKEFPEILAAMIAQHQDIRDSWRSSLIGEDYRYHR